jgi:hypothetical protein
MRGGIYSLPLADRQRVIRGIQHLYDLGPRVLGEFVLESTEAEDLPELLRRLDDYQRLPVEVAERLSVGQWTRPVVAMLRLPKARAA